VAKVDRAGIAAPRLGSLALARLRDSFTEVIE
jgi:hypothetical protein